MTSRLTAAEGLLADAVAPRHPPHSAGSLITRASSPQACRSGAALHTADSARLRSESLLGAAARRSSRSEPAKRASPAGAPLGSWPLRTGRGRARGSR
jgi:hypothetical protein